VRRQSLRVIILVVLVDLIGFGLIIPLLPVYAVRMGAADWTVGAVLGLFALMQLIFAPLWGRVSDHIGRRPILLLGTVGGMIGYVLVGVADLRNSLLLLFVARGLHGMMAGNLAAAQAYIADVTTPTDRARGMGLFGAAFGLAFILGPAWGALLAWLGGWITPAYGTAWPAFGAALASSVATACVWLFVSESLPADTDRRTRQRAPRLRWLADLLADPVLVRLLVLWLVLSLGFVCLEATFVLLCMELLALTMAGVGWIFAYIGLLMVLVQGVLIGPLARRFGEHRLAAVGPWLTAVGFLLAAAMTVRIDWPFGPGLTCILMICPIVALGNGITNPSMTSLISQRAGRYVQGGTLGVTHTLSSFARAVVPPVATALFYWQPGAPYVVASVILLGFGWLAWRMRSTHDRWLRPAPQTAGEETVAAVSSAAPP
jgi:DHA1 family tetracycline resistance protein-like MFS transporter